MQLSPSAHVDTFARDHLPPADQWPELRFDLAPDLHYPDRLNCGTALLDDVIAQHGADRPCVLGADGSSWTYGELCATANRIANLLVDGYHLVPGNRVLLRGPNNPWLAACWFGALKAGAVVAATMALLRPSELQTIDEIAHIDLALCDHRFVDDLTAAGGAAPVVVYGGTEWEHDLQKFSAEFDDVATAADDVAMLAFTSGTTGRPKATMHFHRDVLAIADTFSRHVLQPRPDDVFTGTPPLAFTFGLGGLLVFPLRAGASTLLIEKATPAELAGHIADRGVTVCFTAPTAYKAMIAGGDTSALRTLRRAVSAGEHLPVGTWHAFKDATGVELIDGIGSTEMLHVFVSAADDGIRPGATGRAVPGYEATVLADDGTEAAVGEQGRLAVKGPTGCRYLDDPRQANYVQGGWNITGDTYVRDADGYFWYQSRSDDMIVSSGYNIAGPEVEEALQRHPDVLECAVVGVPDEARGMVVKAFVVLRDGVAVGPATVRELQDFVKEQIAPYKYPRAIEFRADLPRTTTGKLQRYRLRDS